MFVNVRIADELIGFCLSSRNGTDVEVFFDKDTSLKIVQLLQKANRGLESE
jgi:hypothetical protein